MYFDKVKSLIPIRNVDQVLWAKKELFFMINTTMQTRVINISVYLKIPLSVIVVLY